MNQTTPTGGSDSPPSDDNVKLPHDRDEAARGGTADAQRQNRGVGKQALQDVESGQQDTDRHGTPNDIPSSDDNKK